MPEITRAATSPPLDSEQLLAEVMQSIDDGAAIYDANDRLIQLNEAYTQYFSLVGDLLEPGISFREIFEALAERGSYEGPEDGKQSWVDTWLKLFEEGAKANEFKRVDGVWVRVDYYKLPSGGTFVVTADITELRASETALQESYQQLEQRVAARTADLQAANERFYKTFTANPAAVAIAELDGKLYDVNDKWVETFGYTREEALGKTAIDLDIWVDPGQRERAIAARAASGLLENFDVTFRARDGRIIHGLHAAESIEIDGRQMRLGITIDVTERVRAEQALKAREELFARVFHSSPVLLVISRPSDGAHFDVNQAWIETTGYSREEAMAHSAEELGIWANKTERDHFVARLEQEGSVRDYEAKFRAKNGREIDVLVAGDYMDFHAEPRLLVVAHDITERKRVERAQIEGEERLKSIIENSPSAIFLKDLEGRYRVTNSMFKEWYGIADDEIIGRTSHDVLSSDFAEIVVQADHEVLATGVAREWELEATFADSTKHWVHMVKFPVRDAAGGMVGIGTINTDVTERRETEARLRQAQKMEAVGQLTGGVAHDFNNLLAIIMGNAELLSIASDTKDARLEAIARAATRGSELTQRLLAYSRQQPLRPQSIDLGELAIDMSDLLARTLGETIQVEVLGAQCLWAASADAGQVENALLNLAINSRDAMPNGGKLTIECMNVPFDKDNVAENPEALAGDFAMIAVSDTGPGIPPDVLDHVFEPFFTTKEVGQGSGLGLSMVYGFAKQSGGHVSIYSEEKKGTTVKLYLPRSQAGPQEDATTPDDAVPHGDGETVLVVEDDEDVRVLASQVLEGLGYRVIAVADANAARGVVKERDIDLVLSDVVLPGGTSGTEFAEELHAQKPQLGVIFMSGYPAAAAKRNGFLGSDKVLLNKPFQRRQLAEAVRTALDS